MAHFSVGTFLVLLVTTVGLFALAEAAALRMPGRFW